MKKKILSIMLITIIIFTLTGCLKKTAITTETFKTASKDSGYAVTDVKEQYLSYDSIKEATVAMSSSGYQIDFYVLDNIENAIEMYETNKEIFEGYKNGTYAYSYVNGKNYSNYSLTTNGYYMYICRVDNTLLYISEKDTYKDQIKEFIDKLGY